MQLARGSAAAVLSVLLILYCEQNCAAATPLADSLPAGGRAGSASGGEASAPLASGFSHSPAVWEPGPQGTRLSHLMGGMVGGSNNIAAGSSGEPLAALRQQGGQTEAAQLLGAALLAATAGGAAVWHHSQDSRPSRHRVDPSLKADGEAMPPAASFLPSLAALVHTLEQALPGAATPAVLPPCCPCLCRLQWTACCSSRQRWPTRQPTWCGIGSRAGTPAASAGPT